MVTETKDVAQEQSAGLSHECPWTQAQHLLSKIRKKKRKTKGIKGAPKRQLLR